MVCKVGTKPRAEISYSDVLLDRYQDFLLHQDTVMSAKPLTYLEHKNAENLKKWREKYYAHPDFNTGDNHDVQYYRF